MSVSYNYLHTKTTTLTHNITNIIIVSNIDHFKPGEYKLEMANNIALNDIKIYLNRQ